MKKENRITRREFTQQIAEQMGVPYKAAREYVAAFRTCLVNDLRQNKKVVLYGLGTFEMRTHQARKGRNPETGEQMYLPETTSPKFRASRAFRRVIIG